MSQNLSADQELVSDVVACQLVIKQILDVIDVIAPVEVREKMSTQLKTSISPTILLRRTRLRPRDPESDCAD